MTLPILSPKDIETRKRQRRILLIIEALRSASDGYSLVGWTTMSGEAEVQAYAKVIEKLLKRAEEGELW